MFSDLFLLAHLQRCTAHREKLTFPWHLLPSKEVLPDICTYLYLLSQLIYHFSLYKSSASVHHVSKEKSHHTAPAEQDGAAARLSGNSFSSRPLPGSLMISAPAFVFWVTETMFYLLNLSLNMTMQFTGFHLVPRIPMKHKVCKKSLPKKLWQWVTMQSVSPTWKREVEATDKTCRDCKKTCLTFNKWIKDTEVACRTDQLCQQVLWLMLLHSGGFSPF